MASRILLLGRKGILVDAARAAIDDPAVQIHTGTNLDGVRSVLANFKIDHVFMGAGIELADRLEIIKEIFELSNSATVHLKDASSGPQGFLPFVKAVLGGLKNTDTSKK